MSTSQWEAIARFLVQRLQEAGVHIDGTATTPVPATPPELPAEPGGDFWSLAFADLRYNLARVWPLLVFLLFFVLASSGLAYWAESGEKEALVHSYGDAVYLTWMTMVTVGNLEPVTTYGRILSAVDAFTGLILFGVIVWLVTSSLTRN